MVRAPKDFDTNIIRAFKGIFTGRDNFHTCADSEESLLSEPLEILEACIDDLNPEIYDYVMELFSAFPGCLFYPYPDVS